MTTPSFDPFSVAPEPAGAPSEVWTFLVAGGRPEVCWFFFDLKRNAIVKSYIVYGSCTGQSWNRNSEDCKNPPSTSIVKVSANCNPNGLRLSETGDTKGAKNMCARLENGKERGTQLTRELELKVTINEPGGCC